MSIEDKAQEHEAQVWAIHNRPREVLRYAPGDKGYGPEHCTGCDADMHPARRAWGFTECVPCVSATESPSRRR